MKAKSTGKLIDRISVVSYTYRIEISHNFWKYVRHWKNNFSVFKLLAFWQQRVKAVGISIALKIIKIETDKNVYLPYRNIRPTNNAKLTRTRKKETALPNCYWSC